MITLREWTLAWERTANVHVSLIKVLKGPLLLPKEEIVVVEKTRLIEAQLENMQLKAKLYALENHVIEEL
jgi:hypothetical protein